MEELDALEGLMGGMGGGGSIPSGSAEAGAESSATTTVDTELGGNQYVTFGGGGIDSGGQTQTPTTVTTQSQSQQPATQAQSRSATETPVISTPSTTSTIAGISTKTLGIALIAIAGVAALFMLHAKKA